MAIATYGDLVKQVREWTNRSDLAEGTIATFIEFAGNAANQVLRVPAMEHTEILEVTEGGKVAIPYDFLELRSMTAYFNSDKSVPLERVAWDQLINYRNFGDQQGVPKYFARQGPYMWMAPAPPEGTKTTIHYYRSMPDISPEESINWLSMLSPMCYLYGSLHFAYLWLFDEDRSEYWKEKFANECQRIQDLATKAEHVGSSLTVRPRNPQEIH